MESTPRGLRKHIALFGRTNAGKSTLFNLLTEQENAIVSEHAGTTTDPVVKSMELLPYGPVALIDTAGLDDTSELGKKRTAKTREFARRADLGILVTDINDIDAGIEDIKSFFTGGIINVFSKCDIADDDAIRAARERYPDAVFVSNADTTTELKNVIVKRLTDMGRANEDTLVGDFLPYGSTVVMVVPSDSEAPKGRLILPQVQFIRDCLDHGIKAHVTRETELEGALAELAKVSLVVTDSQAFKVVDAIVPDDIPLTSFSILLARQKGNIEQFLDGIEHIDKLRDGDRVLLLEACTHNHTHEDIGRVKIPTMLKKHTGKELEFSFCTGYTIPEDLTRFAMTIMCGSCMVNKKETLSRLELLKDHNIPVSNYGIVLAHLTGTLDRCAKLFRKRGGAI